MNDPKSTNDVRMIAQDVAFRQAEICQAKRENLTDKLGALTSTVAANAAAIATLTASVTAMLAVMPRVSSNEHEIDILKETIAKLQGRPAIWAAAGAVVGAATPFVLWWMSQ